MIVATEHSYTHIYMYMSPTDTRARFKIDCGWPRTRAGGRSPWQPCERVSVAIRTSCAGAVASASNRGPARDYILHTTRERKKEEIVYSLCISACTHHQHAHGPVFCLSIRIECSQRQSSLIFPASFLWKHTDQRDLKQPSLSPFSWDIGDGKMKHWPKRS